MAALGGECRYDAYDPGDAVKMTWLDSLAEGSTRAVAKRTSRRGFLGSLGAFLVGSSALPLLPVARGAQAAESPHPAAAKPGAKPDNTQDPTSCEYWRHCAIDGYLCGCCGGSQNSCPPGTEQSAVTWVGTCHNPADGKDYVVSLQRLLRQEHVRTMPL